jgi:hypothetical protein
MSYCNDYYDKNNEKYCDKLKYNSIELHGIYLDSFYLKIVTDQDEAKHLQIQYDLKYEKDCKQLNKMHSIHKFQIGELANMNGIIVYYDTSEMLEALELPQIEWV